MVKNAVFIEEMQFLGINGELTWGIWLIIRIVYINWFFDNFLFMPKKQLHMEKDELQNKTAENHNLKPNSKWDANRTMGMAAIFISVLSMIAVIYQSYLAREENELMRIQQSATVLPYLSNWFTQRDGEFKFIIGNKGVGPAFIKKVTFKAIDFESKDSLSFKNSGGLFDFIEQQSILLDTTYSTYSYLRANMLLSPNETREILVYTYHTYKQGRLIRQAYEKFSVSFEIVYEDVYGTSWILSSNKGFPVKLKND